MEIKKEIRLFVVWTTDALWVKTNSFPLDLEFEIYFHSHFH